MLGLLETEYKEIVIGHAEIRKTFKISKVGTIAGCYVLDGEITNSAKIRIIRDSIVVHSGAIGSLKRLQDEVKRVQSDLECGIGILNYNDIKEGDIIEAFRLEEIPRTL